MTVLTEPVRNSGFLLNNGPGDLSFEAGVLAAGAAYEAGSVLGLISKRQAAAPIPTIVGTGTGVMTALSFGPDAQVGSYVITLTETASDAAFTVVAPDGTSLPDGAVGTAYKSNHLSFLISDGGTMTAADAFTVVVTAGGTPVVVGGTGTGTMSAITLGPKAQFGTYQVVCRAVVTNGGDFDVIAPDGSSVGRFLMGTGAGASAAFTSEQINFTLTDATDFILGNYFNILVVGYTAPEYTLWNPLAVDGSQDAHGVLLNSIDATAAAQDATAVVCLAEVRLADLVWATAVTAAQKTAALRQFAANYIQAR